MRADPFIIKGEAMWAEHFRDAPMEQWSIGSETYASALDDADDALGRAYGIPTPIAFDLEWYAESVPSAIEDGYEQTGVVHGAIEVLGEPTIELAEVPRPALAPVADGREFVCNGAYPGAGRSGTHRAACPRFPSRTTRSSTS